MFNIIPAIAASLRRKRDKTKRKKRRVSLDSDREYWDMQYGIICHKCSSELPINAQGGYEGTPTLCESCKNYHK